jgi:hypothetical protein
VEVKQETQRVSTQAPRILIKNARASRTAMQGVGKFSAAGVNTSAVAAPATTATSSVGRPAPIGEPIAARDVYRWTGTGLAVALSIVALVLAILAARYASSINSRSSPLIGRESQQNLVESAVLQVIVGGVNTSICSGVFVDANGTFLTAVHCFQEPQTCDFNPTVGEFPLNSGYYMAEVMGINGTTDKYTFFAEVVGWSGLTDVMVMRVLPFTKLDGSVIRINKQPYFQFGESWQLQKGQTIAGLSFDLGFLTKLGHFGAVQAIQKDRGSGFAVTVDQVFFDGNSEPGSSGSGIFNEDKQLVFAPLTYGWMAGDDTSNVYSVSGTSSRISGPLVKRMLNPLTPPNGPAHNKYLVPGLGMSPMYTVSALELYLNFPIDNLAATQSKGVIFFWLASQEFYDFITEGLNDCMFPPYTVTPPSLLGAPLDETLSGTPLSPFNDFPAEAGPETIVALDAIELTPYSGNWFEIGEDSGLETVSGMLARGGYWEGDLVRVRIRSWDTQSSDPAYNWEGIYNVTLQHVDPFWDTIQQTYFVNYAAYIRVNVSGDGGSGNPLTLRDPNRQVTMHLDPSRVMPYLMVGRAGELDSSGRRRSQAPRAMGSALFQPIPDGADIYSLPTLAELYLTSRKRRVPSLLKRRPNMRRAERKLPHPQIAKKHLARRA